MKKFLIFLLIVVGGYFAYDYYIKERSPLEIKASKVVTTSAADAEAPSMYPVRYGSVTGTVRNISKDEVTDIKLNFILGGDHIEANIYRLGPGEERSFTTPEVMIRSASVDFYLEKTSYVSISK